MDETRSQHMKRMREQDNVRTVYLDSVRPLRDASPDAIVTALSRSPTEASALASLAGVPRAQLLAVADLLYVDPYGRSSAVVRRAIVAEARS